MKTRLTLALILLVFAGRLTAQRNCFSYTYLQQQLSKDPSLRIKIEEAESFIRRQISSANAGISRTGQASVIKIPVVVHILYHLSYENVTDEEVNSQIEALNLCYRRMSADSVNTPAVFKPVAADCEIEFKLATSDPRKRNTNGIVRKYTPITKWETDDKVKLSSEMGDDGWDPKSYLNIWVCNLERVLGYSSVPGSSVNNDGVVIGYSVFGSINTRSAFDMGKTGVHEVGHWLGLKHLWGDAYCGDDGVEDTPKQSGYNSDCPAGTRISCGNSPGGDMYMNYMDFTNDACMNLFTQGQKARMRALFASGGPRNSMLSSSGLNAPLIYETPVPDVPPTWLHPQLYPNPATNELTLDIACDVRWIGNIITIVNLQGQTILQVPISAKYQKISIGQLRPGVYFLAANRQDGLSIKQKFMKL